jgi:hypothetical protein
MTGASESAVLEWLRKEGFPLEVKVGKLCRAEGWLTFHSFAYSDPTESKLRECDIYASKFARASGSGTMSVDLAIECKRSTGKPWVVFGEPTRSHDWLIPSMLAPGRVPDAAFVFLAGREPDPLDFLRPKEWVGFNIVKSHTSSKDGDPSNAHSALRATINAAEAFAAKNEQEFDDHPNWPPHPSIVLPVLVVGAPLLLYTVADDGTEQLEPIAVAKVVAPQRRFETRTLITVVSEEAFPGWLDEVTAWSDSILPDLAAKAQIIPQLVAQARSLDQKR